MVLTMINWAKFWTWKSSYRPAVDIAAQSPGRDQCHTGAATMAKLKGLTVQFQPGPAAVKAYRAVIAEYVGSIPNLRREDLKGIQEAVWSSVMKGGDMAALAKVLREQYGMSVADAASIARDQNRKATALIENVRRMELGITHAVWLHSHAVLNPRPSHKAFSGQIYELKTGAYLDGKYVWPGSEIGCMCLSRAIIPGVNDEEIKGAIERERLRRTREQERSRQD
jgi:uncharacterized protein with gpF-like domain